MTRARPRWLVDLAARHRLDRWVLYPGGDAEARLIAQSHHVLGQAFTLTTPPWDDGTFRLQQAPDP